MKFIAANAEEAAAAAGKQKAHMAQTADGSAVRSKWQQSWQRQRTAPQFSLYYTPPLATLTGGVRVRRASQASHLNLKWRFTMLFVNC